MPAGPFERNSRALAGLAGYSRDCLQALRNATGLRYDNLGARHPAVRHQPGGFRGACASRRVDARLRRHPRGQDRCRVHPRSSPHSANSKEPVLGGMYESRDESGDAYKFTGELARLAQGQGVQFRSMAKVEGHRVGGRPCGFGPRRRERVEADAYVVSLGSYSPLLLRPLGSASRSIR